MRERREESLGTSFKIGQVMAISYMLLTLLLLIAILNFINFTGTQHDTMTDIFDNFVGEVNLLTKIVVVKFEKKTAAIFLFIRLVTTQLPLHSRVGVANHGNNLAPRPPPPHLGILFHFQNTLRGKHTCILQEQCQSM